MTGWVGEVSTCVQTGTCLVVVVVVEGWGCSSSVSEEHLVTTSRTPVSSSPVSRLSKMCFDIGIAVCGPNEALVISGMCYVSESVLQT